MIDTCFAVAALGETYIYRPGYSLPEIYIKKLGHERCRKHASLWARSSPELAHQPWINSCLIVVIHITAAFVKFLLYWPNTMSSYSTTVPRFRHLLEYFLSRFQLIMLLVPIKLCVPTAWSNSCPIQGPILLMEWQATKTLSVTLLPNASHAYRKRFIPFPSLHSSKSLILLYTSIISDFFLGIFGIMLIDLSSYAPRWPNGERSAAHIVLYRMVSAHII